MLCDKCRKNEANVHVTQIVNGVRYEQNLCAQCAARQASSLTIQAGSGLEQLMDFFRSIGMAGIVMVPPGQEREPAPMDLDQLGLHIPGSPEASGHEDDLDGLRAELTSCVAHEDFERAAQLRDEIYMREKQLEQG